MSAAVCAAQTPDISENTYPGDAYSPSLGGKTISVIRSYGAVTVSCLINSKQKVTVFFFKYIITWRQKASSQCHMIKNLPLDEPELAIGSTSCSVNELISGSRKVDFNLCK